MKKLWLEYIKATMKEEKDKQPNGKTYEEICEISELLYFRNQSI